MRFTLIGPSYKLDKDYLEKVAKAAFSFLPKKKGEIELKFVTVNEIMKLNEKYRQVSKPTDVLSFNISTEPLIGQVFICYNISRKQAEIFEKTLEQEVSLLLAHGILHIFGYDHENETEANEMEEIEKEILTSLEL